MNIIDLPFDGGQAIHFGNKEEGTEHQRVIDARATFSLQYMKEKDWGDNLEQLTIPQIMEIRSQKEWINP